ncbi:glycosyltransferase family 1 protein [Diplodia corticola]|uniref:Glycosyltransferase family 1 protein n=1 Tax=Diplodia corticola TaxID=236234 RepID=A0A1J9QMP1_9PEZI|nr:glycosyltransferase family 1 protein [Diplodia corticola]OJD30142.1 glycosyltransferase family 1 protein [Diplodia corticola]
MPAMASSSQLKTSEEGHSLPIPVWTEEEQTTPQTPPLVSDDGLHVVVRKPVPVPDDGLHVVSHETAAEAPPPPPPPPYATPVTSRCIVLPSRAAEWRVVRGADDVDDVRLSTLAAAILVREGVLDGRDVALIPAKPALHAAAAADRENQWYTPESRPEVASFSAISSLHRRASKPSLIRSFHRKALADNNTNNSPTPYQPPPLPCLNIADPTLTPTPTPAARRKPVAAVDPTDAEIKLDRIAEDVVRSGKGLARVVGAGLAAPGALTHGLARGCNDIPRRYGDETARRDVDGEIVGFASGLAAAGKGFGYGLYDGITGIFVQPVKGAKEEGAKGFVKGCVKGVGGAVCKPAAGSFGVAGHTLVGIQRSIEKSILRRPSDDECIAVASVGQGEEEMRSLTDQEKKAIVDAWFDASK